MLCLFLHDRAVRNGPMNRSNDQIQTANCSECDPQILTGLRTPLLGTLKKVNGQSAWGHKSKDWFQLNFLTTPLLPCSATPNISRLLFPALWRTNRKMLHSCLERRMLVGCNEFQKAERNTLRQMGRVRFIEYAGVDRNIPFDFVATRQPYS